MCRCKRLASFILKGGTGKTTTVSNLAAALVALDKKVVMIDGDAQCNLTSHFIPMPPGMEDEDEKEEQEGEEKETKRRKKDELDDEQSSDAEIVVPEQKSESSSAADPFASLHVSDMP